MGIRYPEGRIGRPREIGGRHVRKSGKGAARAVPRAYGRLPRSSPSGRTRAQRPGRWTPSGAPGGGSACLLTPLHRPSRLQLALPLGGKTAGCVAAAPEGVRAALGADEAAVAALIGEGPGETRLSYCDPRRSDQKGACERNHVEIRKLPPKGAGLRFDRLSPADPALAMPHVNSEPRGALGFATPALGELDLTPGLIGRSRAERGDAPLS